MGLVNEVESEIKFDRNLPEDHHLKIKFNGMFEWLQTGGAEFNKLKVRYYTEDFRGVHASQKIKNGETMLFVPLDLLITETMIKESEYGEQV